MCMKGFYFFLALVGATVISCTGIEGSRPGNGDYGTIRIGFNEPVASTRAPAYDTNSFILSVISTRGDTIYDGRYGSRPRGLQVRSGTYEIVVSSGPADLPGFESPVYGDRQIVVVSNGQEVSVQLLCRRINAGVRLFFSGSFISRYGGGKLLLAQPSGGLHYGYGEVRTAYFSPGDLFFVMECDSAPDTLFVRNIAAGNVYNLTLNASSDTSAAGFAISVDDGADTLSQSLVIGERYSGADGLTADTALDPEAARRMMGDTVWMWGYIVGGDWTAGGISFEGPFEKSSNIAIAGTPDENVRSKCFPVELSRKAVKEALNLVDNPSNLGRKVFLRGVVSTYFSLTGLKGVTDYLLQ